MREAEILDSLWKVLVLREAWKATYFYSPKVVLRLTKKRVRGKVTYKGNSEYVLSTGKPNYTERKYLKTIKAAGERLPLKRIWIKYPPKRRAR